MQYFKNSDYIVSSQSPPHLYWGLVASQSHHIFHFLQKAEFLRVELAMFIAHPLNIFMPIQWNILKIQTILYHHKVPPHLYWGLVASQSHHIFHFLQKAEFLRVELALFIAHPLNIFMPIQCNILKIQTILYHHKVPPICIGDLLLPNHIIYFTFYKKRNF